MEEQAVIACHGDAMVDSKEENQDYLEKLFSKRIILIDKEFNEETCSEWVGKITLLDLQGLTKKRPIILLISSYGGDAHCALGMSNVILNCICPVITICIGIAYSAGSIILASGTKRYAVENSNIMIHQHNLTVGNLKHTELINEVEASKDTYKKIENFYVKATNQTRSKIKKLLEKDSYITPEEALKLGLIDEIGWKIHDHVK